MAIPFPPNDPSPPDDASAAGLEATSIRILVVEDDINTASLIAHLLENEGYQVIVLYSGTEALDLITAVESGQDKPFDVALLDIMMPYVSGYQVCQEIRRTERLGYIPIIMVTALSSTEDMVRGLDLGADDYLIKPFNPRELVARVRAALRIRDVDRTIRRRNWQLAVLNALNDAIGGSLDRREIMQASLGVLVKRLELGYAAAFLRDAPTGELSRLFYHNGEQWREEKLLPDRDLDGLALGWPGQDAYQLAFDVVTTGRRRWQTLAHDRLATGAVENGMDWRTCVPIKTKAAVGLDDSIPAGESPSGRVWGALVVSASGGNLPIDLDLMTAIGNQIGQALEKSRFYQQARDRGTELVALFDSISDLIYVVDGDYHISALNAALAQWLKGQRESAAEIGQPDESFLGHTCYRILYGREHPCEGCRMAEALRTIERTHWTERRRRPDGAREEWECSAYPIQRKAQRPTQAIVLARDVTERRMLEASLSQSDKLAALGQLAAGLAHEINNPLTAIVANVQLVLMDADPQDPNYESLDLIKRASERAAKVVRGLLDFSRQEQYEFLPIDLNASLRAALELVRHQFRIAQIAIEEDLAPDLPPALASRDHLQGVWLNLLLNARDAVSQQTDSDRARCVRVGTRLRDDGLLEVTVADTGVGIPADRLQRIFEPFFTTKEPGKGTGLGLSTAYQVVKQHGGQIYVDSQVGVGTTFTVLLPAHLS